MIRITDYDEYINPFVKNDIAFYSGKSNIWFQGGTFYPVEDVKKSQVKINGSWFYYKLFNKIVSEEVKMSNCPFVVGQKVVRVSGKDCHENRMFIGEVCEVSVVNHFTGHIRLKDCGTCEWNFVNFKLYTETLPDVTFAELTTEQKLTLIEAYLNGEVVEYLSHGKDKWREKTPHNLSYDVGFDGFIKYRIKDQNKTINTIREIESTIKELNQKLEVLKGQL